MELYLFSPPPVFVVCTRTNYLYLFTFIYQCSVETKCYARQSSRCFMFSLSRSNELPTVNFKLGHIIVLPDPFQSVVQPDLLNILLNKPTVQTLKHH